ncbi:MAG TPA: hypothetical protein VN361_03565 [Oxalicibacterium sp.]|nr:hypothetical protein [Oxalicibacterium sp.]
MKKIGQGAAQQGPADEELALSFRAQKSGMSMPLARPHPVHEGHQVRVPGVAPVGKPENGGRFRLIYPRF